MPVRTLSSSATSSLFEFPSRYSMVETTSAPVSPATLPSCAGRKDVPAVHKAGKTLAKKRSWRKPKDKPKKPLSGYNLFFRHEREKMLKPAQPATDSPNNAASAASEENEKDDSLDRLLKTAVATDTTKRRHRKSHGKIGFTELARNIASKWKCMNDDDKAKYESRAEIDRARYKKELDVWRKNREAKLLLQQQQGADTECDGTTDMTLEQQPSQQEGRSGGAAPTAATTKKHSLTAKFDRRQASFSSSSSTTGKAKKNKQHYSPEEATDSLLNMLEIATCDSFKRISTPPNAAGSSDTPSDNDLLEPISIGSQEAEDKWMNDPTTVNELLRASFDGSVPSGQPPQQPPPPRGGMLPYPSTVPSIPDVLQTPFPQVQQRPTMTRFASCPLPFKPDAARSAMAAMVPPPPLTPQPTKRQWEDVTADVLDNAQRLNDDEFASFLSHTFSIM